MAEFKSNFSIKAGSSEEAAVINKMFENMVKNMDRKVLLKAAHKINAKPEVKIKRLESGVLFL